ncbi:MAG: PLP-dependent transferase [Gemmatimonadaceae bacterium]|nr:PLP-dependent transferase [Gemmatimonadaceae bacterium]
MSDDPTDIPMHFATRAVHFGRVSDGLGPVATPLVQGVNFEQPRGAPSVPLYTRYANTPTLTLVQKRLASLEGAEAAVCLASGMGATSCAMLALLRPGDHLLSSAWIYGGTFRLFTEELPKLGIEVTFVDPLDARGWRRHLQPNTRGIFIETPVNPTCRVTDLRPLSQLTRETGIALVVDSTFASPVNLRPLEHGADIVIASTTKYLNGHHDMLGGAVFGSRAFIDEVTQKMMIWGQAADPFACWLLERGLKTLQVRVERANANAQALAEWCEAHPGIARVHYPGLPSHPDHELATATMDGFGGMLALELEGGAAAADRMVAKLQLVLHATSLGGVDTLICEPRFTSHASMTPEARAALGIPDGFLRVSVGIEDVRDIIADFSQALA